MGRLFFYYGFDSSLYRASVHCSSSGYKGYIFGGYSSLYFAEVTGDGTILEVGKVLRGEPKTVHEVL